MNLDYKTHESYGNIVLTKPRCGGGGQTLFGSKVKHPSFISLEINEAVRAEDGFSEFIHGRNTIVKVYMSEAQWAHIISSFSEGSGTPVTIAARQGQGYIEGPPDETPVIDLAKKSADETKQGLVNRLKDLERDVNNVSEGSGTVRRSDLKKLAMDFNVLASFISSNLDYLENQVVERMEKEVAKANIEIEAIVTNAVARLGREALGTKLASGEITDVSKLIGGAE